MPRRDHVVVEVLASKPDAESPSVPCVVSVGIVESLNTD